MALQLFRYVSKAVAWSSCAQPASASNSSDSTCALGSFIVGSRTAACALDVMTSPTNAENKKGAARFAGAAMHNYPTAASASVATSFQFGSREEMSRAKVQTSVTSVTLSALPSLTLPFLSRVTDTILDWKRTVT